MTKSTKELTFFELTYSRLMVRMEESKKSYKGLLENSNDFTIDESFDTDYDKMPYAKTIKN